MLTKSKLIAETQGEFSGQVLGWVAKNTASLKAKFGQRYPGSRNLFNIQVLNAKGSKRTLVLKPGNVVALNKTNDYKNVIPFSVLRKMGCPTV